VEESTEKKEGEGRGEGGKKRVKATRSKKEGKRDRR